MGVMNFVIDRKNAGRLTREKIEKILRLGDAQGKFKRGVWVDPTHNIAFGAAHMTLCGDSSETLPVWNEAHDIAVVMVGNLFNTDEIRHEIERHGHVCKTSLDAEALVHAYEEFGTGVLRMLNGMYALIIIDFRFKQVLAARDSFGKRSLFYVIDDNYLALSSDMSAFLHGIPGRGVWSCDYAGLSDYLVFGHNVRERTIVRDIKRILPGEAALFSFGGACVQKWHYWSLPAVNPFFAGGPEEAYEQFKVRFETALARNFERSDLQVDLLLSGGVDSAALLCAAMEQSFLPNIFTLGDSKNGTIATDNAERLASFFGLKHNITHMESLPDAAAFIRTMNAFDEPLCSPNALGLNLLCGALSAQGRSTAITGDGGNELMLGFHHFQDYTQGRVGQSYTLASASNDFLRNLTTMQNLPINWGHYYLERLGCVPMVLRQKLLAESFNGYNEATLMTFFEAMTAQCGRTPYDFLGRFDYLFEVPDEILTRLDRIATLHGCELRTPYIDKDLSSFMMSLPEELHFGLGKDIKWMFHRYIAEVIKDKKLLSDIIEHRRQGFSLPTAQIMHEIWDTNMAQWVFEDDFLWWTSLRRDGVEEIISRKNNKNGISRPALTLFALYLWWKRQICGTPIEI